MSDLEGIKAKLEAVKISSFPKVKTVHTLDSNLSIIDAVAKLHEYGVLGAPVVNRDAAPDAPWKERYIGMFDTVRAVHASLNELPVMEDQIIHEEVEKDFHPAPLLTDLPHDHLKIKLSQLVDAENQCFYPFMPVEIESEASLYDLVILLGSFRLKRIPVVDAKGFLVNIITQSSVVEAISESLAEEPFFAKTVSELGLDEPQELFSIGISEPVKNAFTAIVEKQVSAVPVLGVNNKIVGNISSRHIYYVATAHNKKRWLSLPASKFLAACDTRSATWNIKNSAITCKPSESLSAIIEKFVSARIHRVYLVNPDTGSPLRTISLCDVLAKITREPICEIL